MKLQTFTVEILVVPTILEQQLFGAKVERKTVQIQGYTLEDAKKRAGVQ